MKIRLLAFAVTLLMIFAFPQKVKATEISVLYYFKYDNESNTEELLKDEFEFYGYFTREEKAFVIFSNLFSDEEKYSFVPEGVEIINIFSSGDCLNLNVSEEIKSYGGGTSYELRLITQIIKTAINIPSVDKITLLINGVPDYLPEGSLIFEENTLPEL